MCLGWECEWVWVIVCGKWSKNRTAMSGSWKCVNRMHFVACEIEN